MGDQMESTYQGYIASTHDALLVFESVRRGVMPKIRRRLREDERGLIRSGQVFVFDERDSGIKRWTDGLLWSPSRILFNFLVYRQVDKKTLLRPGQTIAGEGDEATVGQESRKSAIAGGDGDGDQGFSATSASATQKADKREEERRPTSSSSAAAAADGEWEPFTLPDQDLSGLATAVSGTSQSSSTTKVDATDDRSLVGSLTTSFPFAKNGLCKKTISIQTEHSTQHLISYYSIEDVRSGRLRTPSSLPEIASLPISPALLTRTTFRHPPAIRYGPDGIPRYDGEGEISGSLALGRPLSIPQSTASGSTPSAIGPDYLRPQTMQNQTTARSSALPMRNRAATTANVANRPGHSAQQDSAMLPLGSPLSHQIGGSGILSSPNRRTSDAPSRAARTRYEPYPTASLTSHHSTAIPMGHGQATQTAATSFAVHMPTAMDYAATPPGRPQVMQQQQQASGAPQFIYSQSMMSEPSWETHDCSYASSGGPLPPPQAVDLTTLARQQRANQQHILHSQQRTEIMASGRPSSHSGLPASMGTPATDPRVALTRPVTAGGVQLAGLRAVEGPFWTPQDPVPSRAIAAGPYDTVPAWLRSAQDSQARPARATAGTTGSGLYGVRPQGMPHQTVPDALNPGSFIPPTAEWLANPIPPPHVTHAMTTSVSGSHDSAFQHITSTWPGEYGGEGVPQTALGSQSLIPPQGLGHDASTMTTSTLESGYGGLAGTPYYTAGQEQATGFAALHHSHPTANQLPSMPAAMTMDVPSTMHPYQPSGLPFSGGGLAYEQPLHSAPATFGVEGAPFPPAATLSPSKRHLPSQAPHSSPRRSPLATAYEVNPHPSSDAYPDGSMNAYYHSRH